MKTLLWSINGLQKAGSNAMIVISTYLTLMSRFIDDYRRYIDERTKDDICCGGSLSLA